MADLINMLPSLEDALLANLGDNARRLACTGTEAQRTSAAAMLAAVEAECARRAETAVAAKPKRTVRCKAPAPADEL